MRQVGAKPAWSRRFLSGVAISLAANLSSAALAQVPCHYEVAAVLQGPSCGIFGLPPTFTAGVSPNGQYVCGFYYQCGASSGFKAFVYRTQANQFITLPFPPGAVSIAAADVNDSGLVVGQYEDTIDAGYRGFIYDSNAGQYVFEVPPLPGGAWSNATGINNAGDICGWRSIGSQGDPVNPYQAFVWSAATGFTDLGVMNGPNSGARAISENGMVIGWTGTTSASNNTRAFIHQDGRTVVLGPVPGGFSSSGIMMADNGEALIIGRIGQPNDLAGRAFRYFSGNWTELFPLEGDQTSSCAAVTAAGMVVGSSRPAIQGEIAFKTAVWSDQIAVDVQSLILPPPDFILRGATAASDAGLIASLMEDPRTHNEFAVLLKPVGHAPGDSNCDQIVDVDDLFDVINEWGPCPGCTGDFDGDALVNVADLLTVVDHWTFRTN